ncbi:hypothetical protein C4D60_Mb05t24580 [Musa balbisiana]|uniref:Ycf20-like protein n=1 Tax=Musa balbisiana TaxID=52838 RepID=A0A4S8JYM8_MUSBA|nr:hypothetical protein C4D60_Mb05t24580 [Musa balbisiana]
MGRLDFLFLTVVDTPAYTVLQHESAVAVAAAARCPVISKLSSPYCNHAQLCSVIFVDIPAEEHGDTAAHDVDPRLQLLDERPSSSLLRPTSGVLPGRHDTCSSASFPVPGTLSAEAGTLSPLDSSIGLFRVVSSPSSPTGGFAELVLIDKELGVGFMLAAPSVNNPRRMSWAASSMADGNRSNASESSTNPTTRLVRTIQSFQTKLNTRIKQLKKGLSVKVLFFLVGFYCATAFATVIGQTGDWDILSAGLAVVVVEGIGALMYRASLPYANKIRNLVTVFNYWKAGLSLGLFLDAFKYEIDSFFESCKPMNIEIDIFPPFW